MRSLNPWILAARPKTLGAAVAPVLVGSALGWKLSGQFCLWLALATLGSCVCLQIATNLCNDALDGMKGGDTARRIGPLRITASGMMPARTVLKVAAVTMVAAVLLAVPLWFCRGWPILVIGIPSLWFCYGYTGGPLPLAYRGLGELFVVLFFGLVAVTGSAFVQSGHWHFAAVVAGLQLGMLSTVLIAINNLRDIEEDTMTGKRTLAVRFGKGFARREILWLHLGALALCLFWGSRGWNTLAILQVFPIVLLGGWVCRGVARHEPSRIYNRHLAFAGMNLLLFAALTVLGLWLGPAAVRPD